MSPSPVREALALLLGERVLEASHRNGFSLPRLMPYELAEEYRLLGMISDGLVRLAPTGEAGPIDDEANTTLERSVWALACRTGVTSALPVIAATTLRIANYLRAEPGVLNDFGGEARALAVLVADGRRGPMSRALRHAYRRRIAAAATICRAAESTPESFEKAFE